MQRIAIILVVVSLAGFGQSGIISSLTSLLSGRTTVKTTTTTTTRSPTTTKPSTAPLFLPKQTLLALKQSGQILTENVTLANLVTQLWYNIGVGECNGFGPDTGTNGTAIGNIESPSSSQFVFNVSEFGGPVVCREQCNGKCVPYRTGDGPLSLYPFNCKCSSNATQGCGTGQEPVPIGTTNNILYVFKPVCKVDSTTCPCRNMDENDPNGDNYQGLVCTWQELNVMNTQTNETILAVTYDPILSPIRWCDCCPKN